MAVTSVMLPLGTAAPRFSLPDVVSGSAYSLDSFSGEAGLLVMFLCRHCPYVQHVQHGIAKLGHDYRDTGLGIIGISSNDPAHYPDDAPDRLNEMATRLGFTFPFCFDETQEVAKGNNKPVTGRDLRLAIDAVLAGKPVDPNQKPSIGCSIKWKPGNDPADAQ